MRPREIDNKFFNYVVKSDSFTNQVDKQAWGIAYPAINNSQLTNIKIVFPSGLTEQLEIADYLDEKTNKIDQIIKIKEQQLMNLSAQRKTLIYEVVTGKRGINETSKN